MSATLTWQPPARPEHDGQRPSVLAVVTHTDPLYGGLSTGVPRLGLEVERTRKFEMFLAAFCTPDERTRPADYDDARLSFWPASRRIWIRSRQVREKFAETVRRCDAVHIHGLWEASTALASRTAAAQKKPYLLSAHGMLEPWALNNRRWKKAMYAALFERKTVANATCLHALTQAEAEQYRAFGATCPIAVIPNAVQIPVERSAAKFLARYPHLRHKRIVLFMSRLHPKKGVDLLADAWARVARENTEAHLVLAGPDSEGTAARAQQTVEASGLQHTVTFTGMLEEEMKWSALAAAECFVLPSFSEGLSMSVLEALGSGVPVIITRNCNMPEVKQTGAGWVIQPDVRELMDAMCELLCSPPEKNRAMGWRGAQLIASRYVPGLVAAAMAEIYEFMVNGTLPNNVELHQG